MKNFIAKLKSMLNVDFRRMFTQPLVYIMAGILNAHTHFGNDDYGWRR